MSASTAPTPLHLAIRRLAAGDSLDSELAGDAFRTVMRGEAAPSQIAALLIGLRVKGETPQEVAGAATALREAMVVLPAEDPDSLVDTCGTGGGTITTFNISTAAALLAAGLGVRVAKHGNRSFTSLCGSADVLESLGVRIEVSHEVMERSLRDAGLVFMFAPLMHPAMKHVGPVRRELAVPTVMNIVGPLANPARAGRQVIGVADERRLPLLAGALRELGTVRALVVHGSGMDEISPLGITEGVEIIGREMRPWRITPEEVGLPRATPEELAGGDPQCNADIITEVLSGRGTTGARSAVVLNAAAALYVAGDETDYRRAVEEANEGLHAGAGMEALERLRRALPV